MLAGEKLDWRPPAGRASRRPLKAKPRSSGASFAHEADAACSASAAAQRAAEAARPAPVRRLELVAPHAADRLKRGSGYGNVPRPLTDACLCEQAALDGLVVAVEEHALSCGACLRRVAGDDKFGPVRPGERCAVAAVAMTNHVTV